MSNIISLDSSSKIDGVKNRIPSLDGMRAVSILMVVLAHGVETFPASWRDPVSQYFFPFFSGRLGVRIFFVISGFLITTLLLKELRKTNSIDLKKFYLKRIFRIFPAFYAYLGFVSLLCLFNILNIDPGRLVSASLFLVNYSHLWISTTSKDYWFIGHLWTLCIEGQFYLLFPLILMNGEKRTRMITLSLIILVPVIRVLSYLLLPSQRNYSTITFHTAIDPILIGAMAAMLQGRYQFERLSKVMTNSAISMSFILFLFVVSPLIERSSLSGTYMNSVGITLSSILIVFVMLWLIRKPETLIGKMMNSPVFIYLGQRSYSLYLWQQLFQTPSINLTFTGMFPLNFLLTFLMAELSYRLVETRFLKMRPKPVTIV
jgi:peptidoglycan/LPS O-acetylase OafA/YrhL